MFLCKPTLKPNETNQKTHHQLNQFECCPAHTYLALQISNLFHRKLSYHQKVFGSFRRHHSHI